jgi:protocatechuate 3,4-dioxygenase beta subunit
VNPHILSSRRGFLKSGLAVGAAFWTVPGLFAEQLARTPRLTEGPFYPDKMPLDTDNDLVIVGNSTTPAIGEVTHLGGRVLSPSGEPVNNVTVEIWQVDGKGVYLHSRDNGNGRNRDKNFQGFGKFTTGSTGEYRFRTIKPVPYPGRTPHIHVKVKKGDRELLTTQIFIAGDPQNLRDGIYLGAGGIVERELVSTDFVPVKQSKAGELAAKFDIVLGRTPELR